MTLTCAVVLPCYNEAARLNLQAFRDFLTHSGSEIRFIFVDDGSTDSTLATLREFEREAGARVDVLVCDRNGGKAEAVRQGMLHALRSPDNDVIGFWDADLATPLAAIHDLLGVLGDSPSIHWVFGARVNLLGRRIHRRAVRHYLGRVFATVVSTLLRMPVYDTQCGAKLFRATGELGRVLETPFGSRWVFDVEMIARLLQLYGRDVDRVRGLIYEFPLYAWEDVAGSKVRSGDFVKAVREVFAIYVRYLR